MKYVPLQVSSPRSGFNVYVEPREQDELLKHYGLKEAFFKFVDIKREGESLSVEFSITGVPSADARALVMHGQYARASIPTVGSAVEGLSIPDFGMTPAKLWLLSDPGRARLEFSTANLSRPIHRSRAHSSEGPPAPPAPAPAPEPPKPQTVPVLLTIAGKDMMFNLPIEEAFSQCLEWTQRGYKEAA